MTIHVTQAPPLSGATKAYQPSLTDLLLLAVGFLVMYLPTYVTLNNSIWNIVGQGHGPVMLALTVWLAYQRWEGLNALPLQTALPAGGLLLVIGLLFYIAGHSQDILLFDVGSQIPLLAGILLLYKGWPGLKKMWFPLFFLVFLIPMPSPAVDALTGPLKAGVSYVAEWLIYEAGYPVGRAGVMLTIGPYQLLVADACAGLNSIFALEAIGVFYMSVAQHTNKARNIALAIAILPISFVSNVIRVIALVLVTYYFGDAVGQGFVHDFAGILLFMVATALTIFVDLLLGLVFKGPKQAPVAKNSKQTV